MRQYTKEWLQELCQNSYSYAEVLQKAGRKQGGGTQATLKKKIAERSDKKVKYINLHSCYIIMISKYRAVTCSLIFICNYRYNSKYK